METTKQTHKLIVERKKDNNRVYCYCDNLPNERITVTYNYKTKKFICSVCGSEVIK